MTSLLKNPAVLIGLLITIALVAVLITAIAVILLLKSRKKAKEAEAEAIGSDEFEESPAFSSNMRGNFREAMRRLKERLPGWNYRYEAPWYVLVGESGSGKTTAANELAGLNTDIVEPASSGNAPRWLLLDRAVLIDVPGSAFLSTDASSPLRTSPASSLLGSYVSFGRSKSDRAAWRSFLRLAVHYRPRQPLNGIVLTISALELLEAEADPNHQRRLARIAQLADRLHDVQHVAGLSLPVYVLVTKCDAVTGFGFYSRRFFEDAIAGGAEDDNGEHGEHTGISDDLLGWSNPHALDSTFSSAWVDEAFDSTNEVLLRHQLRMLARSRTAAAADGVFVFPFELERLQAPLRALLNMIFRETAYHAPHLLRGIYFCGRESESGLELAQPVRAGSEMRPAPSGFLDAGSDRVIFVRDVFLFKVFAERYLATALRRGIFSSNRSVKTAQIAACVLAIVFLIGAMRAWHRIASLQADHIDPVLESLASGIDSVAIGTDANVSPAVELIDGLGAAHESEYYSLAFPYSYTDLDGLHRNLHDALERTFEIVVLRSCKFALENRISTVLNSGTPQPGPAPARLSSSPSGDGWKVDRSYRALDSYLSQVKALKANIDRYNLISGAGSGSFTQLNALLEYLGGQSLPNSSLLATNPHYQKLLLDANWQPLQVPSDFDQSTAAVTNQLIANFFRSWFDSNPLIGEVDQLAGIGGLEDLIVPAAPPTNEQLSGIVSQAQKIDGQLGDGAFDWLAGAFNRQNYPALGSELDQMPFADRQFTDAVTVLGTEKLAALKTALATKPQVVDISDGRARLSGEVHTVASVLDALLGNDLMAAEFELPASSSCTLVPTTDFWNQADLTHALEFDTTRNKIESELLGELPGEYRTAVRQIVNGRAVNAMSAVLEQAAAAGSSQNDKQAAFDAQLQNMGQSSDLLRQIGSRLSAMHAASEAACLNRSVTRQANALLANVNDQMRALYSHGRVTDNSSNAPPLSEMLYGVTSADDLEAYLETQRQQAEALSSDAAPLLPLLRAQGSQSTLLSNWRTISQDVAALQAKKPGNPIQTLETYISTGLDKVVPEANCKADAPKQSTDIFLNIRAQLSQVAVAHCRQVALARFNEIAAAFNDSLAGRFPFSEVPDTRSDAEASPQAIAAFYQVFDRYSAGLANVLPDVVDKPADASAFLGAAAVVRSLVSGTGKDPAPALGVTVEFRTNLAHEVYGDHIAEWSFNAGQKGVTSRANPAEAPPLVWQFGDPVTLTLRYAYDSPELPSTANPSSAAHIAGRTVTYTYSNAWSLFALLRDSPPGPADQPNQYAIRIPNSSPSPAAGRKQPPTTVVYLEVNLLPPGAKAGSAALPVPAFPTAAPVAAPKLAKGE
ncbi:MAG TPA: type VI secretion protein IcmF/TssM N-terminal domain-containing protein [Terracidiphilus sp.]|jgi:type VI secretion system protein ImpL